MPSLESTLSSLDAELRQWMSKQRDEFLDLRSEVSLLNQRFLGRDMGGGYGSADPFGAVAKGISENLPDFERHGRVKFSVPSLLLGTKVFSSSGLTNPVASPDIGHTSMWAYGGVRAALRTVPVAGASVFQVRETANSFEASPQTEASDKYESSSTLTGETLTVRTFASWLSATKQALSDVEGLSAYLRARLLWALEKEIEEQLLSGDNTGQNLNGLITAGTVFDSATYQVPSDGWEFCDMVLAAQTQCMEAGWNPDLVVISPNAWYSMSRLKTSDGAYVMGTPTAAPTRMLWGRPVILSPALSSTQFLVGDSSQALIRMNMDTVVDLSESHSDYFIKNQVAIRAEQRLCLQILSPSAFIQGTLTQSPA